MPVLMFWVFRITTLEAMTEIIINAAAAAFGVTVEEMKSKTRRREVAYARYTAMRLIRENTKLLLSEIGELFGRDHATALHGIRRHSELRVYEDYIKPFTMAKVVVDRLIKIQMLADLDLGVFAGAVLRHHGTEMI